MPQLTEIWTYRGLVGNFAQRELRGKYKGSALGWFWSLLNPLATLAVYALVFGFFLKFAPPVAGNGELKNFAVYLFTALVAWNFFYAVVTGSIGALAGSGPLLKKIYFPAFAPVIGGAGATLFQTGIEVGLLIAFLERPLRVLTRDQLLDFARGSDADVYDRAIDVQVSRLRKKLADHDGAELIVTVRSEGYLFSVRPVRR